jgi:hypothetical protein
VTNDGPSLRSCVTGLITITLGFALLIVWYSWYIAGLQAAVYRRQGIEVTQWELFHGAKPAERAYRMEAAQ